MKINLIIDFLDELKSLLAIKDAITNGVKPEDNLNLYLKANRLIEDKMLALIIEFEEELNQSK